MIKKPGTSTTGVATLAIIVLFALANPACFAQPGGASKKRVMENLGRGVVALNQGHGKVFVSWRLLGTDPEETYFNIYAAIGDDRPARLNQEPITGSTHFVDRGVDLSHDSRAYFVRPIVGGREGPASRRFVVTAHSPVQAYVAVPLKTPTGYTPNDTAVGDLDGDGEYELIVKQEMRGYDNSQRGICPGTTKLEAYRLDGTFLWRIDLGKNIREGAHYTPFIVYDLDSDGRAEVAVRTAEGTVDGTGVAIPDTDGDGRTDYVNTSGYILEGPEFLSIFDGRTGREIARTPYLARSGCRLGRQLRQPRGPFPDGRRLFRWRAAQRCHVSWLLHHHPPPGLELARRQAVDDVEF